MTVCNKKQRGIEEITPNRSQDISHINAIIFSIHKQKPSNNSEQDCFKYKSELRLRRRPIYINIYNEDE